MKFLRRFFCDITGASAMEYTLAAALLAAGIFLAVQLLGSSVGGTFTQLNDTLASSGSGASQASTESPGN